jgi:hypothetical protein
MRSWFPAQAAQGSTRSFVGAHVLHTFPLTCQLPFVAIDAVFAKSINWPLEHLMLIESSNMFLQSIKSRLRALRYYLLHHITSWGVISVNFEIKRPVFLYSQTRERRRRVDARVHKTSITQ